MLQTKENKKEEEHILEMIPIRFLVPANLTQAKKAGAGSGYITSFLYCYLLSILPWLT